MCKKEGDIADVSREERKLRDTPGANKKTESGRKKPVTGQNP